MYPKFNVSCAHIDKALNAIISNWKSPINRHVAQFFFLHHLESRVEGYSNSNEYCASERDSEIEKEYSVTKCRSGYALYIVCTAGKTRRPKIKRKRILWLSSIVGISCFIYLLFPLLFSIRLHRFSFSIRVGVCKRVPNIQCFHFPLLCSALSHCLCPFSFSLSISPILFFWSDPHRSIWVRFVELVENLHFLLSLIAIVIGVIVAVTVLLLLPTSSSSSSSPWSYAAPRFLFAYRFIIYFGKQNIDSVKYNLCVWCAYCICYRVEV